MYLRYFSLNEAPFSITPDPAFVFLSPRHRDALAHLLYGIGKGGSGGFKEVSAGCVLHDIILGVGSLI